MTKAVSHVMVFVLCALMVVTIVPCGDADTFVPLPECFTVTHRRVPDVKLAPNVYFSRWYPATVRPDVDKELHTQIDTLADALMPVVPREDGARGTVCAQATFSGRNTVSFLLSGCVSHKHRQLAAEACALVYDMDTGARVRLADILTQEGLAFLQAEARKQLTAYFADEQPDADALDALLAPEALQNADFTMSVARLRLHYKACALYPGKTTLMHVTVYYDALREYFTDEGVERTNNADYRLAALTYDDGPNLGITLGLLNVLCENNATATFFVLGNRIEKNAHVIARQHDLGHTVASHNYVHAYTSVQKEVAEWKAQMAEAMQRVIGLSPAYMRAPGGQAQHFIDGNISLPLINWSVYAGDNDKGRSISKMADNVVQGARDGSIVLMHDINNGVSEYTKSAFKGLRKKGLLLVSVEELFAARGIPLDANCVYSCTYR